MEKVGSILYLYRKSLCHSMSCSLYTAAPQNLWAQIHDCTWISQCLLCFSCYRTFVRLREYQESGNECLKEYHFSISAFNKTQQPPELRQVGNRRVSRVYFVCFQANSRSEALNTSSSSRVLSFDFYLYKRLLMKMINIVLSYIRAYVSYISSKKTIS